VPPKHEVGSSNLPSRTINNLRTLFLHLTQCHIPIRGFIRTYAEGNEPGVMDRMIQLIAPGSERVCSGAHIIGPTVQPQLLVYFFSCCRQPRGPQYNLDDTA
jgi:hypothetical protein